MRKLKDVLRLRFELGLSQRQIARSCSVGLATVHDYLQRAEAAGVKWPLPEGWDEQKLESSLFATSPASVPLTAKEEGGKALPDFAKMHEQRQKHRHLTLQLLWEEYKQANPEGLGYSWFCELYQQWRGKLDVVLRQEYQAGEKVFVDWAGETIPIHDREGGETRKGHLFVAVLGASSYTYAEVTADEQMDNWLGAHMRAFEFFGGVPKLIVPDNAKTGVNKACRYDPDLNPTYQEMALHYGVGVVPARPYKPRDKAKVESGVLVIERWIYLEVAKVVVPASVFLFGLLQYRRAQAWKRMEFVAQRIEKFRADPIVRRALTMLDWGERRIDLGLPFEPIISSGDLKPPRITYRLTAEALRTHHGSKGGFSSLEAAIRDQFDQLLDYLSHFEHFIQAGLVKQKDIRPYLEYWTNALAGNDEIDSELLTQFWRFVDAYGYSKVRQLICRFHPEVKERFPVSSPLQKSSSILK